MHCEPRALAESEPEVKIKAVTRTCKRNMAANEGNCDANEWLKIVSDLWHPLEDLLNVWLDPMWHVCFGRPMGTVIEIVAHSHHPSFGTHTRRLSHSKA